MSARSVGGQHRSGKSSAPNDTIELFMNAMFRWRYDIFVTRVEQARCSEGK